MLKAKRQRQYYINKGLPPNKPHSVLSTLDARTKSRYAPPCNTAHIYVRLRDGTPAIFRRSVQIVMYHHRPHWQQTPGQLVPLERAGGILFMKGHGRKS